MPLIAVSVLLAVAGVVSASFAANSAVATALPLPLETVARGDGGDQDGPDLSSPRYLLEAVDELNAAPARQDAAAPSAPVYGDMCVDRVGASPLPVVADFALAGRDEFAAPCMTLDDTRTAELAAPAFSVFVATNAPVWRTTLVAALPAPKDAGTQSDITTQSIPVAAGQTTMQLASDGPGRRATLTAALPERATQPAPAAPKQPAMQVASLGPAPAPTPTRQRILGPDPQDDAMSLPLDGRTAVYDIAARKVYLPSGRVLEAHSGLGKKMDDPRYVHVKNQGPTPPNLYDLKLREALFHGVRALRLNPVPGSKMFGRDGILAHSFLLGPNGQSHGCVSFRDYQPFLQAYLRGEIKRVVVVGRLPRAPSPAALAGTAPREQYTQSN